MMPRNVENTPNTKANAPVSFTQRGAFQAEEHLQAARRLYNANVSLYNQTIRTIPWVIVAALCHMEAADFYEADEKKRDFEADFD